jgi:hypothetical protein
MAPHPSLLARLPWRRLTWLALPAALAPWLWSWAGPLAVLGAGTISLLLVLLWARSSNPPGASRLKLVERRGLGAGGGELWLVEVDGRAVLVACGRGFAAIRPLRPGAAA